MPLDRSLLDKLHSDHPHFRFVSGTDDHWDGASTIYYHGHSEPCHVLHELAHALLGHNGYPLDIDLIRIERAAWDYARQTLGPRYGIAITTDDAEEALDTYRNWLHNRSLCPNCASNGIQNLDTTYTCVACRTRWQANEAKTCALRRRRLQSA